jgi:CMP-N-acetylneuraminic acid synthetase
MILGVIPARGGSKSIPGKNIRELNGKPLIAWVIEAGRKSVIDRLVVSTDDAEIARVAVDFGAEVMARPAEISGDKAASELALLDVLDRIGPPPPEKLVMLQCTSPLTRPEDIDACIAKLDTHDCCFSVHRTSALLWDENGGLNHDWRARPMRQDRMQYEETGAIYAMRTSGFRENRYRFFGNWTMHCTPRNVDINDLDDFLIAEVLMNVS